MTPRLLRRSAPAALVLAALVALASCGGKDPLPLPGSVDADKFLFDRGSEALKRRKWLEAREYFRQLVDSYPQSAYRAEGKLGIGDSYLGERRSDSDVFAVNEFREFLSFFPLHPKADYAQYRIGQAYARQMLGAQRDQTATRDAIREFERFLERYPTSALRPEVEAELRRARDRLSDQEYQVGLFYYRNNWFPGALARFHYVLKEDPGYTRRDGVYFHIAESIFKAGSPKEALPWYAKLVEEFETSQYLEPAKKRIAEITR